MREGYQVTELGEIPIDWHVKQINEVTSYVDYRGKTPPKVSKGICLVTARNIKRGKIDYNLSEEYVPVNQYNEIMNRGFPKIGDVLITTEAPLGEIATIDNENVALAQRIIKYRGLPETLNNLYLKHTLMGHYFQELLEKESTGSTVKGIKGSRLHKLSILIPPLQEQEKIATILTTVDEKIEIIDAQITQTRELKKGLMQKLLTRGIGHTKFQDSVLGEIPESWEVKRLKDISVLISGLHLGPEEYNREEIGVPYFTGPSDYSNSVNDVSKWTNKQSAIALANDTLITVKGSGAGGVFYLNLAQVFISRQVMAIRANSDTSDLFIFQYLTQKGFYFQELAKGNMIPGLSRKDILLTEVPVPPLSEQEQISTILCAIDEKLSILQTKKESYQELKKGLMQQLLTGKVRVFQPELEIA